ncbi:hypothetical protein Droror1_Dr00010316 [Drosera rotundifolia]
MVDWVDVFVRTAGVWCDGWCWTDDGGLWDFQLILRLFLVIDLAPRPWPRRTRWWLWCLIKAEGREWCLMDWCFGFFPAGSLCSPARRVDFFFFLVSARLGLL